eukprot:149406_1
MLQILLLLCYYHIVSAIDWDCSYECTYNEAIGYAFSGSGTIASVSLSLQDAMDACTAIGNCIGFHQMTANSGTGGSYHLMHSGNWQSFSSYIGWQKSSCALESINCKCTLLHSAGWAYSGSDSINVVSSFNSAQTLCIDDIECVGIHRKYGGNYVLMRTGDWKQYGTYEGWQKQCKQP